MFNVDFCVLFCVAVDVWIEENRKMEEITREIMENAQILCRICFGEGRFYIENHQIRFKDEIIDMSEVLAEFSALEIFDTESVPSMICSTCADDLERCYITLRKIRKSDEEIQKIYNIILKETDVNTSSQDDSDFIKSDYGETEETDARIFCTAECSDENISVIDEIEGHNPEEFQILEIDTLQNTDSNNKEEYILDISNEYIDSEHIEIERQDIQTAPRKSTDLAQALSEILAKVDENTLALEVDRCDDDIMPTNAKKCKYDIESTRFILSKFVLSEPKSVSELSSDFIKEDLLCANSVSQIRILDINSMELKPEDNITVDLDHDETNVEDPNTIYMCKWCARAFSTSYHLIMHARKSHICQFCMKAFEKLNDFHKHTKEAHASFNCLICRRNFSSNSNLKQHIKRVHNIEMPPNVALLAFTTTENDEET